jgi:hypothetical protein
MLLALAAATLALASIDGGILHPLALGAHRARALFFLTTDCPIANSYGPTIAQLCDDFRARGVDCLLVYVDPRTSPAAARTHREQYGMAPLAAVLDPAHALVRAAGATVTPEAALLAPDQRFLYRGRIDNRWAGWSRKRPQATHHTLRLAVEAALSGAALPPNAPATGCYIAGLALSRQTSSASSSAADVRTPK